MKCRINNLTYLYLLFVLLTGLYKDLMIIITILVIHEIGHIIMIMHLKYHINELVIYPFGGVLYINKPINCLIKDDLLISVAGIGMQFILILIIYILKPTLSTYLYNRFLYYNILIAILNLLPIYPLDGYKLLNALINYIFSFYNSYCLSIIISIGVFLILIFSLGYQNFIIYLASIGIIISTINFKKIFEKFNMERLYLNYPYRKIKYLKDLKRKKIKREIKYYINHNKY